MKKIFLIITCLLLYSTILFGQFPSIQTFNIILNKEYSMTTRYPLYSGDIALEQYYTSDSLNTKSVGYYHGNLICEMDLDSSVINAITERGYSRFNLLKSFPIELLYFFHDSIVTLSTAQYYLPLVDTIIPKMSNLKFLWIYGRNYRNFQISKWNIPLIFLHLDWCELPSNIDINQFESSLKILEINTNKIKKNTILNYSKLDNLEYFSFQDYSKNSQYSIIFPKNIKCIHYMINNNQTLKFPISTEILFLAIKNKKNAIPILTHLINLKFLSILPANIYDKKNYVPLPKEISQLKSLHSLQILYLNDDNIEVISQIPHLTTLQLIEQKEIPQNLDKLINIENIDFSLQTPDSIIQSFKKALPNVKIKRCEYYYGPLFGY